MDRLRVPVPLLMIALIAVTNAQRMNGAVIRNPMM